MSKWHVKGTRIDNGASVSQTFEAKDYEELKGKLLAAKVLASKVSEEKSAPPQVPVKLEEAYGLTRRMAGWAIVIGLLLSPALFGVPAVVWGIVAICKMNRDAKFQGKNVPGLLNTPLTDKQS